MRDLNWSFRVISDHQLVQISPNCTGDLLLSSRSFLLVSSYSLHSSTLLTCAENNFDRSTCVESHSTFFQCTITRYAFMITLTYRFQFVSGPWLANFHNQGSLFNSICIKLCKNAQSLLRRGTLNVASVFIELTCNCIVSILYHLYGQNAK